MNCERCNDRPAEYGLADTKGIMLKYPAGDGSALTAPFQPGKWCEECLAVEAAEECDRLADRERLRLSYRLQRKQLQAANDPLICAECRQPMREFLSVRDRMICQSCAYIDVRNDMLQKAIATFGSSYKDRCQAILSTMQRARVDVRQAFEQVWG